MYYWFDLYQKRRDGRIWLSRCLVLAGTKRDAEKSAKEPISEYDPILIVFRNKSEDYNSKVFKEYHKSRFHHEGIVSPEELRRLGLEVPKMQIVPYEHEEIIIEEEVPEEEEPKYKAIKCEFCGEEIPKNGAAQYSHLRKHVKQLVARGVISERDSKKIRKVKLEPATYKIFKKAFK